jgi:hypothetical protein
MRLLAFTKLFAFMFVWLALVLPKAAGFGAFPTGAEKMAKALQIEIRAIEILEAAAVTATARAAAATAAQDPNAPILEAAAATARAAAATAAQECCHNDSRSNTT